MSQRIVNTWDQMRHFGGDRVAICYNCQDTGRGGSPAKWVVLRLVDGQEAPTNPGAPWYDWKRKVFILMSGRAQKKPKLQAAIAWVAQHYGERAFVRNRLGDYVETEVNAKFPIPAKSRPVGAGQEET